MTQTIENGRRTLGQAESAAEIETLRLVPNGRTPNNRLAVVVYRHALLVDPAAIEAAFAQNDWRNAWRNGIYPFHHFHSIAHEVLGIAQGYADVRLGGEAGQDVRLSGGDVVVLPAGTGHKRLAASADLLVVGAYPGRADWDLIRVDDLDEDALAQAEARIATVPRPRTDPLFGETGPLIGLWNDAAAR